MSGIEEKPVSREEISKWDAFAKEYLNINLYLGSSKSLIIAEFFGGIFILGIVGLFIMMILPPGLLILALIILGMVPLYWGTSDLGKYLSWRVRRNEWIRRATR